MILDLNFNVDETASVKVRNNHYPVSISGEGVPCLVIGLGTLMQRTLSQEFKKHFKVYSSDLYWDNRFGLENPSSLDLDQILDDIFEMGKNLGLSSYVLFGHSAYGIVAMEYAKKFADSLEGIIMVGTPVNSNSEVAQVNDEYFKMHADPQRKEIDAARRAEYLKEDLSKLDISSKFLKSYIWRDGSRYWHQPAFDCTPLWEGIIVDDVLNHFFADILPKVDVRKGLETIAVPTFLAAGLSDFDCCPWDWLKIGKLPQKLTVSLFSNSGHYPNYEEEKLFDERIISWKKTCIDS